MEYLYNAATTLKPTFANFYKAGLHLQTVKTSTAFVFDDPSTEYIVATDDSVAQAWRKLETYDMNTSAGSTYYW